MVNVPVGGPSGDADVVGSPHLDLSYHGTAEPQKTWIYAQFVNPRNGEEVFKLVNVNRSEPAAYLFQVPAGFQIIEMK